jgi:hypothetical protein
LPETSIIDTNSAFVFETKYCLPRHLKNVLLSTLNHRASPPVSFPYAKMRTIYFDDVEDTSFFDSRDGNLKKKKYRLREYIDSTEGASYSLEIKIRDNTQTRKIKELMYVKLPEDYKFTTFRDLIGTFEALTDSIYPELRIESSGPELYPDTIIYYERMRFEDNYIKARYNVDTNIYVSPYIKVDAKKSNNFNLDHGVFEIKTAVPEYFPAFLRGLGLERFSFSKYVWGKSINIDYPG